MKSIQRHFLPLFLLSFALSACQSQRAGELHLTPQDTEAMPVEFLIGTYEVIGRYPDSEQLYAGTVEISLSELDTNAVSITRIINGTSIQGDGKITNATGDTITVLRVVFEEAGQTMEATYLMDSDLNNYARLTGYVYVQNGETRLPGIESLFHDHYRSP